MNFADELQDLAERRFPERTTRPVPGYQTPKERQTSVLHSLHQPEPNLVLDTEAADRLKEQ